MIVTLTGAYKNVGDHLIGFRGRALLEKFVDSEIINVDRKSINDSHYDLFNKARAVFLCGGPAYQKNIFPKIYPIDLNRIKSPVIPFGLGYKSSLQNKKFEFEPQALKFVQEIHCKLKTSSARDLKTVEALKISGIDNVTMTGCPAWYDLEKLDKEFVQLKEVRSIAFSGPAKFDKHTYDVLKLIDKRYPKAKKYITYHHGIFIGSKKKEMKQSLDYLKSILPAIRSGFEIVSFQSDLPKMCRLYNSCDLHLGYRVHAHLYCLSQRKATILLSEDQRGVSQSLSLGLTPILMNDPNYEALLNIEFDTIQSPGYYAETQKRLTHSFSVMKNFLLSCEAM